MSRSRQIASTSGLMILADLSFLRVASLARSYGDAVADERYGDYTPTWIVSGLPTNTRRRPGHKQRHVSACSALVSVDLIQLCCREAVGRTWTKLLLSPDWYQHRRSLVLNEKHDELCWFSAACVPANGMNVVWTFIKGLSQVLVLEEWFWFTSPVTYARRRAH